MIDLRPAQGPRLVLQLSSRDEGLIVRVVESAVGGAAARVVLQSLEDALRMVSQPTFHEDVGQGLFRALFPGALADLYRAALAQARAADETLTLELRFDRDLARIAKYPWELLHDGTRFLLQTGTVNLARCFPFPEPPRSPAPRDLVDMLFVSARPTDQSPLASAYEDTQAALQSLIREDRLDLAYLLPPTWDTLMDWLLAGAPGALHFEGHGALDRGGALIFEDAAGLSDMVEAETLGSAFYSTGLRLVVLSASEASKTAGQTALGSVAPSLIMAGIPAVVAMQHSLPRDAAAQFAEGFYRALLDRQGIEAAVAVGRRRLSRTTFWHIPALYLRAVQAPGITSGTLERRIEAVLPRFAPVNRAVRGGLWIRRPDAPPPSGVALRRLLGPDIDDATPERADSPADTAWLAPGPVEVRISAPGGEMGTAPTRWVTVWEDSDPPPVWFPLAARRTGTLDVTFELAQHGAVIASATRAIQITEPAADAPRLWETPDGGEPATPGDAALPQIEIPTERTAEASDAGRESQDQRRRTDEFAARKGLDTESQDRRRRTAESPLPSRVGDAILSEALDGVTDWVQAGEPPVDEDDPLVSGAPPGADHALADDLSAAPDWPWPSSPAAPPPESRGTPSSRDPGRAPLAQTWELPAMKPSRRRVGGMTRREWVILLIVLAVSIMVIGALAALVW
jgi:hypothetical protein